MIRYFFLIFFLLPLVVDAQVIIPKVQEGDTIAIDDILNLRNAPSIQSLVVDLGDVGQTAEVIGNPRYSDGQVWHPLNIKGSTDLLWASESWLTVGGIIDYAAKLPVVAILEDGSRFLPNQKFEVIRPKINPSGSRLSLKYQYLNLEDGSIEYVRGPITQFPMMLTVPSSPGEYRILVTEYGQDILDRHVAVSETFTVTGSGSINLNKINYEVKNNTVPASETTHLTDTQELHYEVPKIKKFNPRLMSVVDPSGPYVEVEWLADGVNSCDVFFNNKMLASDLSSGIFPVLSQKTSIEVFGVAFSETLNFQIECNVVNSDTKLVEKKTLELDPGTFKVYNPFPPRFNHFACDRVIEGKISNGSLACYGHEDKSGAFGWSKFECSISHSPTALNCVRKIDLCESGVAEAQTHYEFRGSSHPSEEKLNEFAKNFQTSPEVVRDGIRNLWEYYCIEKKPLRMHIENYDEYYGELPWWKSVFRWLKDKITW